MHRTADADGRGRLAATLRMAHLAEPLMRKGGTLFTITLRQPNGGEELQHHGRRQSGAGSAVCFLAADATRLITGETLYITAATTSSTSSPRLGPATEGAGTAPAPSMKR